MNTHLLLAAGFVFALIMVGSSIWMLRTIRREERVAARVRVIHGQPPVIRKSAEPQAIRAAIVNGIAAVGQAILRSGMVSARTCPSWRTPWLPPGCAAPRASASSSAARSC